MTFSIVGYNPETHQLGVAVCSSSMAAAARCAHVRAGVGAIVTQNLADPCLGPRGLEMLGSGYRPDHVVQAFSRSEDYFDYRQLAIVNAEGHTAVHTGAKALGGHGTAEGEGCAAVGNLLAAPDIPARMVAAFGEAEGKLADRLLAGLAAAVLAGGETGPVHSAGLLVAEKEAWPLVDLRVDWTDGDPVAELIRLWERWRPQMYDFVMRALDPPAAPPLAR